MWPDVAFQNHSLFLMQPFTYVVDLFLYMTYFSFPNICSYFHAMKIIFSCLLVHLNSSVGCQTQHSSNDRPK
jgi:hypothetical protein